MYSEEKITEMAAYLLNKEGGSMPYIKLLKLLYLAEREAMARWGESMSGDNFVSMPHGPVLSQTYDLIKGGSGIWASRIKDEANHIVSLRELFDFQETSPAILKILDETYFKYGRMGWREIVKFTHDNCPEWRDPQGSSYPITPKAILIAMGKTGSDLEKLLEKHQEQKQLDRLKAALV